MSLPHTDSPPSLDVASLLPGWKISAVIGTIVGMLTIPTIKGVTKKDAEIAVNSHKLVNIYNKREQSRFARLTRSFRVGGVVGGVYMMTFTGVLNYLTEKRGIVDAHNFAASGAVAGGAFGLMVPLYRPGLRHGRVLSAMISSVSIGVIFYPIGWVYVKLLEKQKVYFEDLLKQIKEGESEQCDEAHMNDQEAV